MADYWLYIIPNRPEYVPSEGAQVAAEELFREFVYPPAFETGLLHEIRSEVTDDIEFVHAFQWMEHWRCPRCRGDLDLRWWQDRMNEGYQVHFRGYTAAVPCCQVAYSLNDLVYEMPAGFARYSLGALYPSVDTLTISQLEALASILGCNVRQIWQRI